MSQLSIRSRLTIWYSTVLFLGLALFGAVMWWALEHRLVSDLDTRLQQRVDGLRTVLMTEGESAKPDQIEEELTEYAREVPAGNLMQMRGPDDTILLPSPARRLFTENAPEGTARYTNRTIDGRPYRVLASRIEVYGRQYDVHVAGPLNEVSGVAREFRNLLFLLIPVVLLSACGGGYWISRRALKPVDEITSVAKSISVQNLSERLAVPQTGDELQRMSEAWNELLDRLEGAVERIKQFTADASHELRTPIALIRTTAELALRRPRPAAEYQHALLEIQREAERMTELAESLLVLARSDAKVQKIELAPVDLNEIVEEVCRQTEPIAKSRGVILARDTVPNRAVVRADAAAMNRLLLALADNALKHTSEGDRVTISTRQAEGGILLSVRDTGEGIPQADLPHVFERFFRVDAARGHDSGAGLGLAIAQSIAAAHGTTIAVESVAGAGSEFQLVVPNASP
jgi:heavy metal sensor kinase